MNRFCMSSAKKLKLCKVRLCIRYQTAVFAQSNENQVTFVNYKLCIDDTTRKGFTHNQGRRHISGSASTDERNDAVLV